MISDLDEPLGSQYFLNVVSDRAGAHLKVPS